MNQWQDIATAPKGATEEKRWKEHWVLGTDGRNCKVIRWCMEYPYFEGVWIYADSSGCSDFLTYHPTHWMPLPLLPNK